jgi:hypothetical protein
MPQPSHYTGVYNSLQSNIMTQFVHDFMQNLTAISRGIPCTATSQCEPSQICLANRCLVSNTTFYHGALSPGLYYDSTSGYYTIINASEPTWTESTWTSTYMFLYVQDSSTTEMGILLGGIIFLIVNFVMVYCVLSYLRSHMKTE